MTARGNLHAVLAWGLLALVLAVAATVVALPLARAHAAVDHDIERAYGTLVRLETINDLRGATEERAREIREELFGSYLFSNVENVDDLALEVRKLIDALAARYELSLTSIDSASPVRDGELVHAGVRIRATGSVEALGEVLREIEAHRPLLFIERLSLSPTRGSVRARRAANTAGQMLAVDLEVSGYFLEAGVDTAGTGSGP